MMTPLHIKMLFHYHAVAEPYAMRHPEHANSAAVEEYRNDLLSANLIEPSDNSGSGFTTTERGRVYVDAICSVPWPVQKWVMPND
jgi:hypothetical protein